jgi:hypothetical protein
MDFTADPFKKPEPVPIDGGAQAPSPPTARSGLAVASLVFGALSPVLLCTCVGPLVTGPLAIVLGHVALARIGKSGGQTTGRGLAVGGLALGYVSVVAAALLLTALFYWKPIPQAAAVRAPEANPLATAERAITSDSRGTAFGNSPEAIALAARFSAYMEAVDKAAFTDSKAKLKLSGGHYVTWCELRPGRCAFVVHVPEYRRFSGEAKELLAKFAWIAAQRSVGSALEDDDQLAVGLKGVLLYGAVMTGDVSHKEGENQGLRFRSEDKTQLFPFFAETAASDRKAVGAKEPEKTPSRPEGRFQVPK